MTIKQTLVNQPISLLVIFFWVTMLSACSSTENTNQHSLAETNYNFTEIKSFDNDHQLLLSLINRPLPEDQQIMMRFARVQYGENTTTPQVGFVSIRGERSEDKTQPITFAYSELIYQDQNAIMIGAPR